ncbi:AlaS protein [Candidatus Pantoea carbekii]|uniref:Alanine--tRNA ligase n=1 Tax=Candidatus Pantoea carbekii TaxID=1235990 RepID=U3U909_9GAMM|nr:AlaS protein [Candidatus Pantoea carbekii]
MSKSTDEIRQTFLNFFHTKGHQIISSSSLIPDNDPTMLFTNAGMVQFKNVFIGQDRCDYKRVTTSQRCVRAGGKHNDLENVGYTARHHTFFEMLGNFSFGDYFKKEAISYAWELLTSNQWFNLPKERLWITVYENDDETLGIWKNNIGVATDRIICIGNNKGDAYSSDNFWQMGDTGPCGPCTEIFYNHGDDISKNPLSVSEDNRDQCIEIWNIVFIQFNRHPDGSMTLLKKPSIDTGMGLERLAAVLQNVHSNYEIDLFKKLINRIKKIIGLDDDFHSQSLYVIADHIRSCAFLIADGVIPSNAYRGYVLRRIIRRAVRHGNKIGIKETFFYRFITPLIEVMDHVANNIKYKQVYIENILKEEEEQFSKILTRGLVILDEKLSNLTNNTVDGQTVFDLYDTFGFPMDLTEEICRERNLKIDKNGFEIAMKQQRQRAYRAENIFKANYNNTICIDIESNFKGYEQLNVDSTVQAIFVNCQKVHQIFSGQNAVVFLNETPFYSESSGQIGDTGILIGNNTEFNVENTQKYNKAIGHIGQLKTGNLCIGDHINAQVNEVRRKCISLNHSATHLLHTALREVLGEHVVQKGSLINDKYLRFDFFHFEALTPQQICNIENIVNKQIRYNLKVKNEIVNFDIAKKKGAIALFGEKYDQYVRLLTIGNFSSELCTGTHVMRTGEIGLFFIQSESSVAMKVRRIEAFTGEIALEQVHFQKRQIQDVMRLVKANQSNFKEKICSMLDYLRTLEKELKEFQEQHVIRESIVLSKKAVELKSTKLLVSKLEDVKPTMLRNIMDKLKAQLGSAIIVLAIVSKGKISLIAGITPDLTKKIQAIDLINELVKKVGGKGGGRPDIAQAGGGMNIQALGNALSSVHTWVNNRL